MRQYKMCSRVESACFTIVVPFMRAHGAWADQLLNMRPQAVAHIW
jgi:hypothetical protein